MDISAVLTVAAEVAGASGLVTVSGGAARWMRGRARFNHDAELARALLDLRQRELVAYRHDSVHVQDAGTIHPDNLHALAAASGNAYVRADQTGRLVVRDEIHVEAANDLVLIGSPTAENLSRLLFGYSLDGDPDSLALDQVPVDLPYRWVISKNMIDDSATARRFVPGRGLVERPNWRVSGPGRSFVPRLDDGGFLIDDYLLVTKLRNYLSRGAIDQGKFVVSFGGTHGTGTRAIELLFRDRTVLAQIATQLKAAPGAFQMLLRVSDIDHDRIRGSRARKIEMVDDIVILPDTDSVWRTAAQTLESRQGFSR